MKRPFDEKFVDTAHADPLDGYNIDFNWDALYESLGENDATRDEVMERAAQALGEILHWTIDCNLSRRHALETIGRRVLCAAWVTNPDLFSGASLASLARRLGIQPSNLSPLSADFSRRFKVRNRGQAHDWQSKMRRKDEMLF